MSPIIAGSVLDFLTDQMDEEILNEQKDKLLPMLLELTCSDPLDV